MSVAEPVDVPEVTVTVTLGIVYGTPALLVAAAWCVVVCVGVTDSVPMHVVVHVRLVRLVPLIVMLW